MVPIYTSGASQITDSYTVTLEYGGGVTFVKSGRLASVDTTLTSQEPLTFKAKLEFMVGAVT